MAKEDLKAMTRAQKEAACAKAALVQDHAASGLAQTSEVRNLARMLLDSDYLRSLKTRLDAGLVAPGVEVMLWRYAFGDPKTDVNERAHEIARFEAIRETVRQRIRSGQATLIDAQAQGARRVLRLAPQPETVDVESSE